VSTGRIRRSFVILSKIFVLLLGLLILFVLEENIRGWVSLHLYLHQLRCRGEQLTLAELETPKSPQEENGASALLTAAYDLHEVSYTYPLASDGFDVMKLVEPGCARVLCVQPTLKGMNSNGEWQMYAWEDLSRELDEAAVQLRRVKDALKQPSLDLHLDYSQGFSIPIPHVHETRNIARWLESAALDDVHKGNLDEAVTDIATIASLTRFQKNERLVISQLVRMAVGEIGLDTTWEALQAPGWTDAQLARLSEVWRAQNTFSDMVRAVEEARTCTLVDFDIWRRNRSERMAQMAYTFDVVWENDQWVRNELRPLPGKIRLFLASELWRLLWSYQDECRALHNREALFDMARTIENGKSWVPVTSLPAVYNCHEPSLLCARSYFSSAFAGPGSEQALLRILFFETQREMTRAVIAIKRYQLRTAKLPSDLAALVPEYLSEIPHDWMDGQPLRYRLNADGTFNLYSVGEDGKDDGGDPSARTDSRANYLWYCRDAVWPTPINNGPFDTIPLPFINPRPSYRSRSGI
jgi:hypothetical protein